MIRIRTKKFKQEMNSFILYIMSKMVDQTLSTSMEMHDEEFKLINLISYFKINQLKFRQMLNLISIMESISKILKDLRRFKDISSLSQKVNKSKVKVNKSKSKSKSKSKKDCKLFQDFCIFLFNAILIGNFLYLLFLDLT